MAHKFRGMVGIDTDGLDVAPNELMLTTYDEPHLVTYWRLLDADDNEKGSEVDYWPLATMISAEAIVQSFSRAQA